MVSGWDLSLSTKQHGHQELTCCFTVTATIYASGNGPNPVEISVLDNDGRTIASQKNVFANRTFTFNVPSDHLQLWTPDTPRLYNLTVKMGDDVVSSYTGFRTISSGIVKGVRRPLLNGKFVFHFGTLDQGFWPDGIQVPPTLEALEWDLLLLKRLGMNMVRKHVSCLSRWCLPYRGLTFRTDQNRTRPILPRLRPSRTPRVPRHALHESNRQRPR